MELNKQETSNHYLKLDLGNSQVDIGTQKDKYEVMIQYRNQSYKFIFVFSMFLLFCFLIYTLLPNLNKI